MSNLERPILLPAPEQADAEPKNSETLADICKAAIRDRSYLRSESLGFFQLAVAYDVPSTVEQRQKSQRKPCWGLNFSRDLHITNRYLNMPDATYQTLTSFAGVRAASSVYNIIHTTLAKLYDNFPWDQVAQDVQERYPRDLVIRGKKKGFLSPEGSRRISEAAQNTPRTMEAREAARKRMSNLMDSKEFRDKRQTGFSQFIESPRGKQHRQNSAERLQRWQQTSEGQIHLARLKNKK